jgi:hypothetical protein
MLPLLQIKIFYGIYGGQSGTETGYSPNSSAFPCQHHSTIALRAFLHHPLWIISGIDEVVG